jgi:hypothetical protein
MLILGDNESLRTMKYSLSFYLSLSLFLGLMFSPFSVPIVPGESYSSGVQYTPCTRTTAMMPEKHKNKNGLLKLTELVVQYVYFQGKIT